MDPPDGISKFDLTMEVETRASGFKVAMEYDTALFDAETIDSLLSNFETLLCGAVENPNTPLSRLPLVNQRERQRMLVEWNETRTLYPRTASIPALFDESVRQTPDETALEFADTAWSYKLLDRRS